MMDLTRSLMNLILLSTLCAFSPAAVGAIWMPCSRSSFVIPTTPPSLSVMRWVIQICLDFAIFKIWLTACFTWGDFRSCMYWVTQNPSGEMSPTMKGKPAMNMMSTCTVCAFSMTVRSPGIMGGDDLLTSRPLRLGIDGPHT